MNLLDLYAKISIDSSEYEKGLDKASEDSKSFASKLGGGLKKAGGIVAGAMAATTAAVGAVGGVMIAQTKQTAEYGDAIDKNSQKLGISAKSYQEWEAVLQHSGSSMGSMGASFKKLATAAQDASDDQVEAFKKIGLSMEDVANMSTEELWSKTINGLQGMEEGTERTALATQLLGKGAQELGPLFNTSAEDTQAMIDRVNELGGVMSDTSVKDAAAFQDALQDMTTGFDGAKRGIVESLMPALTDVMTLVTDNMPAIQEKLSNVFGGISEGIKTAADFVRTHFDDISNVIQTGAQIISDVFGTMWSVVKDIFSALKGAWDEIAASFNGGGISIQSVVSAVQGAISIAGQVIVAIIQAVGSVISWLVSQATTSGTVLNTVFNAIKTVISAAMNIAKQVIGIFVSFLKGDFNGALNGAKTLVSNIFNGIKTTISNVMNSAKSVVSSVLDGIKNAFSSKMEAARSAVSSAVERIKGIFNFSWKLPDIKVPHFSVSGGEPPFGIMGKGSLPHISVSWYAKAMESGYMFTTPTVLDTATGLKGFGDAGAEMVIGRDSMMRMISEAQTSGLDGVIAVLREIKNDLLDYRANIGNIIASVLDKFGIKYNDRELARLIREVMA